MMKDVDIIYFTLFPWDHPYSSVSFSFAKEFIKNNRVFYFNPPYSYKDFLSSLSNPNTKDRMKDLLLHRSRYEKLPEQLLPKEHAHNFHAIMTPMVPPINFLSPGSFYESIRSRNNEKVLKTIEKTIKDYNIKKYIFLNCYNPYYAGFLPRDRFNPLVNIYQCIDDTAENDYSARHGVKGEREAIQSADVTTVTGTELKNIWGADAKEIHLVHNAADIRLFARTMQEKFERPTEIKEVTNKIIGFIGNLDNVRIDYPLILKTAKKHTDKTVLLIGPVNSPQIEELGIDKLPNVIMTGSKDINDLPSYLQFIDVAIIPFAINKLTKSIYPLKINEYLAAGRAVLATNFSEDIRSFNDVIYISENHDDFVGLVDKAIAENNEENIQRRIDVANSNTWTSRVDHIWTIVENYLAKKGELVS